MRRTVSDPGRQAYTDDVPPATAARRRDRLGRRRVVEADGRRPGAGAAVAGGAGSALLLLARLVRLVTSIIVGIIVVAIVLIVLKANPGNSLVQGFHDAARSLVGPFDGLFNLKSPRVEIAVNWGLAALVYSMIGGLIASAIARAGLAGAERSRY